MVLQKFADYGCFDETWYDLLVDYVNLTMVSGIDTITAGNTYVVVTHGKGTTPTLPRPVPLDDLDGRSFWISNIGATTFRINISSQDMENHQFKWVA